VRPVTRAIATIVLLSLAGSTSAFAQASSSSAVLRGQIVDSIGAAIQGATITITDLAKGSTRSTTTDAEGNYAFIGLLPDNYEIKVSAEGFATTTGKVALTVGLFRDQHFDAPNFFDYNPDGKSPFNRKQYGGSLLGPIKQDKTFFFTAIERLSQERTTFVNLLTDPNIFQPTASQNAILGFLEGNPDFTDLANTLRDRLTTTPQSFPNTVEGRVKYGGHYD
jgi:Carboxypeptidase regulatory-like domain